MNRFILGFQRRVWWPKWTPASSNCFIVTTATVPPIGWSDPDAAPPGGDDRGCAGRSLTGPATVAERLELYSDRRAHLDAPGPCDPQQGQEQHGRHQSRRAA